MIAALYVQSGGCYFGVPCVDPWDESRDARMYRGPHPVVAHPPCARWGRYWAGGPSSPGDLLKGDDGGCFAAALWAVRTFGGVIEHPAQSYAWPWFGLPAPGVVGWGASDTFGGRTCSVDQGHYGHAATKTTWIYAVGIDWPDLDWTPCKREPDVEKYGDRAKAVKRGVLERMSKRQRAATPPEFRDLLIAMARSAA